MDVVYKYEAAGKEMVVSVFVAGMYMYREAMRMNAMVQFVFIRNTRSSCFFFSWLKPWLCTVRERTCLQNRQKQEHKITLTRTNIRLNGSPPPLSRR